MDEDQITTVVVEVSLAKARQLACRILSLATSGYTQLSAMALDTPIVEIQKQLLKVQQLYSLYCNINIKLDTEYPDIRLTPSAGISNITTLSYATRYQEKIQDLQHLVLDKWKTREILDKEEMDMSNRKYAELQQKLEDVLKERKVTIVVPEYMSHP